MLLSLGLFGFAVDAAPFETIKRSSPQRWEEKKRIGLAPALQWLGPEAETITIDGTLVPGVTGGVANLVKLRNMAASGKAWLLMAGSGDNLGPWVITGLDEGKSHMLGNGMARKITFSLSLKKYPDDLLFLGNLMDSRP